jgi:hypothetical protein
MGMELVNGIPCFNCTDVERAKKVGLDGSGNVQDPLHPSTVLPANGNTGTGADAASPAGTVTAVDAPVFGVNQPLASGDRGTQLNLLA